MKRKIFVLLAGVILIALGIGIYMNLTNSNRLTSEEKRWINDNTSNIQNVNIINDVNVFGKVGEGLYYSFLEDFTATYEIKFNPITMTTNEESTNLSLTVGNRIPENAFSFYQDHYVLVSKNEEMISDIHSINNKKIGILKSTAEDVKKYLAFLKGNTYTEVNTLEELTTALKENTVQYILVPRIESLDTILKENFWMAYHFSDLSRYFYIKDDSNSTLYQILKKYYANWQEENLENNLYLEERNLFTENLNITDSAMDELKKTTIRYGYQNYLPYEIYGDGKYGGIIANFLERFAAFSDIEIDYKKYNSDKKFIRDINNNKLDLYTNFYNYGLSGKEINLSLPMEFDIYVHKQNPLVIESIESLKNKTLYIEDNSYLQTKLSVLDGCTLKTFELSKIDKVLKDKENILLLDHQVGDYLLKGTLKNYSSRYTYTLNATYTMKSLGNDTLNTLLVHYFNYLDSKEITNIGIYQSSILEKRGSIIGSLARYALYAILIIIVILLLIYRSSKKVRLQKKIKKEDKLKYVDQLTSLKNRNYLNENLAVWNKNTIYPQSVVMIDLNKVQEINDTLGYEEGDRQIKAAANILIKTQLDNSDIIRTNGNEFMIYFVGYNQKQITSYMHKLNKNFKTLPFNYGISISYSMIERDTKSIEDAINECVEDIKKQKGKKDEDK